MFMNMKLNDTGHYYSVKGEDYETSNHMDFMRIYFFCALPFKEDVERRVQNENENVYIYCNFFGAIFDISSQGDSRLQSEQNY